jgi:hypothetical protein
MTEDHPKSEDEKKTFDMYHFFSRKDILAVGVLLLVILLWLIFHSATHGAAT